jgi:hypothetical protein
MANRTYVPGLRLILGTAHRYCTRWQPTLEANLTELQYTCLLDVITALASCLAALGPAPINP